MYTKICLCNGAMSKYTILIGKHQLKKEERKKPEKKNIGHKNRTVMKWVKYLVY